MTDTPVDAAAAQELAEAVAEAMWSRDRAAQALGMRIDSVAPGRATLSMPVRSDMVNGHHICHGGLIFSLADTALLTPATPTTSIRSPPAATSTLLRRARKAIPCRPPPSSVHALGVPASMTSPCVTAQARTLPCSGARATALPAKSSPAWLPTSADRQVDKNREKRGQSHACEKPPSR